MLRSWCPRSRAMEGEGYEVSTTLKYLTEAYIHADQLDDAISILRTGITKFPEDTKELHFDFFGSHQYSFEELVAEMTACFLSGTAGIHGTKEREHAGAYLKNWLKALKDNPGIKGAAQAERATNHILNQKPEPPKPTAQVEQRRKPTTSKARPEKSPRTISIREMQPQSA
ncbi:MAG: zincin-like metallopeptidase domain-containing protein [Promethearchaeota archaeon]